MTPVSTSGLRNTLAYPLLHLHRHIQPLALMVIKIQVLLDSFQRLVVGVVIQIQLQMIEKD